LVVGTLLFRARHQLAGAAVEVSAHPLRLCHASWGASESDIILGVLSLIDVTLTANLVLIVVFSSYENFVSRIDPADHPDWPEWMRHIDFSGLKQKVLASIVAISAVQVLKAFMNFDANLNTERLAWLVGIHLVFVISTLLLAWSDQISEPHSGP
jgi:uncharacterized protein (TIGR00645 family)